MLEDKDNIIDDIDDNAHELKGRMEEKVDDARDDFKETLESVDREATAEQDKY